MSQQELLRKLEQRLTSEYKDTEAVIRAKIAYFTEDFDKDNKLHQKMVKDGVISRQEYKRWYKDQMFAQKWANKMTTVISEDLTNANVTASKIINNNASAMFIDGATEAVKELKDYDPFEVFDTRQIKNIADENAKHLPESRVQIPKDQKWNEKRIKSSLMQSAVKGESAQQLAGRLLTVVGMNRKSAIRNARTMMTGSHNMGKLELGNEALEMGLDVRKKWIATFDSRTRDSHASLHGEVVDMDEEFSNGLMFPADPDGDPAEVYNCRCTMVITHDPKRGGMSKEEFEENVAENEAEKEAFKQANKDLKSQDNKTSTNVPSRTKKTEYENICDEIEKAGGKPIRPSRDDFDNSDDFYKARDEYKQQKAYYDDRLDALTNITLDVQPMGIEELKGWCDKYDVVYDKTLENVDGRVLRLYTERTSKLFDDFPEVVNYKYYSSSFNESGVSTYILDHKGTRMYSAEASHGFTFGANATSDGCNLWVSSEIDGIFSGYNTGTTSIDHLFDHEFGHRVYDSIKARDYSKAEYVRKDFVETVYNKKGMSEYATTNDDELFAEAFSAWYGGVDSEFANAMGDFLKRWNVI